MEDLNLGQKETDNWVNATNALLILKLICHLYYNRLYMYLSIYSLFHNISN